MHDLALYPDAFTVNYSDEAKPFLSGLIEIRDRDGLYVPG